MGDACIFEQGPVEYPCTDRQITQRRIGLGGTGNAQRAVRRVLAAHLHRIQVARLRLRSLRAGSAAGAGQQAEQGQRVQRAVAREHGHRAELLKRPGAVHPGRK
ncbi:hypothetical protein LN565_20650 [Xanthomonas euvesicatoria pv. euvesicatoria]|uniref:Uncharacterized protein n=1 Tax=Xanthomonas euvesicatoria pv. euvesicatoria TaxID=2753541 RepID=A0ABS8LM85_XANEU|nr:hypothetical protein [Xanthomonas euvesicatoria]MCC8503315.1 hypothetical protein [Xanthomonas euvesicatoria pv. euvesicatoria]MCC8516157.1 hypothetical protein [Xanthomonas euvesicatoria pv. euvesicatoria]MCC8541501.1 hypothetical protein [Xanthomonas euvesicatoria pv. euvesicatoria]MCC8546026.1 hypothetical protein [Xanthomonas euvesicatoria pv. euvesicatoria]MCC8569156.1 hypothetical protein [Xanthomonas euvesicatoria pv. euvesicatoria]